MKKTTRNPISMFGACFLLALSAHTWAQNSAEHEGKKISQEISRIYDSPAHKVVTAPVAIVSEYAIADWLQGEKGGRALLRRIQGKWEIMLCGGDGLKELKALSDAGIPNKTAQSLVSQLENLEKSLSPAQLKRFGMFGAIPNAHHPEHSEHQAPAQHSK